MTDNQPALEKQFTIQKIHVKDVSLETPNSPAIFTEAWDDPKVEINLSSNVQGLQADLYEVSLTVTVTVKIKRKTAYLVEVCQAGIFSVSGLTDAEMGPMLGSFCPNLLFPYAREVVSDLVSKGGFPPMHLAPVNFDALYAQHVDRMKAQQTPAPHTIN
ncbi:MAG: protein-export chaperone SecB [Methylococcales bacterium]